MKTSKIHQILYIIALFLILNPFTSKGQFKPASAHQSEESERTWQDSLPQGDILNNYPNEAHNSKEISRISIASNGVQGSGPSRSPSISNNGRFVAFESSASNLVNNDSNNKGDIFVHDLQTGQTIMVSVSSQGIQANDRSVAPKISADGRCVTFESEASNLVSSDNNDSADIFVHDIQTGQTERVSVSSSGVEGDLLSLAPSISYDGQFVAFLSYATNLVNGDTNDCSYPRYHNCIDAFVHDRQTGETTRISVASDGTQANNDTFFVTISNNGRFLAFKSWATNLVSDVSDTAIRIYQHDRQTAETLLVSFAIDGTPASGGNPSITADGRYAVFSSSENNLVSNDTNNVADIFVYDKQTESINRVSIASDGSEANGDSMEPVISANGNFVSFYSEASNLAIGDQDGVCEIFTHNLITRQTSSVSHISNEECGHSIFNLAISDDGRYVVFDSSVDNLVENDTNDTYDIFVYDKEKSIETYIISGHVHDTTDAPLSNVIVSAGTDITTVTDVDGAYTLIDLIPGAYTLTADKPSWAFDPPTRTVVLDSDVTGQDFTGIDVSAVISQVGYLANDTGTCLNRLLHESRDIAEDGDYFAIAKKEDQVELIADAIVGGAGILAEGVDSVANAEDLMKISFPGVVGRGWGHVIDLRNSNEVARDAFRKAMLQPVTAANARRAAKELFNGAHLYYAADIADTAADDFLSDVLVKYNWQMGLRSDLALQNELYPANEALVDVYVQNLGTTTYHTMDNVPFMTPDVQAMYIEDLNKRSHANIVMASTLENQALPLHLARNDRETEEDTWFEGFLAKYLLKQLVFLWGDGPAALAVEGLEWGYELYQNHQRLKEDMRMMLLSVEGMGGAATSENRIYLNTVNGMDNIVQGIEPQIARGSIRSLMHISEGEYKFFGSLWWCEKAAYSELDISNLSSYSTSYQGIVNYESTGILGGNYEPLVEEDAVSIPGGDSGLLRIYYKQDDEGVSPDEIQTYPVATEASAISITVLGSTDTGTYYILNVENTWVPARVETSGAVRASLKNQQAATTIPYPIRTRVTVQDDDLLYYSYIWIDNPFTQTVNITLTQTLPADVEIIASDAVSTSEGTLVWHQTLDPQTTLEITHTFRYQGAAGKMVEYPEPQLTMTNISATMQLTFTGETELFTSLPPLSGVGIPPAEVTKGMSVSIPITVTNRLSTETVSGAVQLTLINFIEETRIYSDTYPVSLTGGTHQSVSFTLQTSDIALGNYLLAASIDSNGSKEDVFEEYFAVQPIKVYLPLILSSGSIQP